MHAVCTARHATYRGVWRMQLATERANALLNRVAAGSVEGGYASVTYELAAAYREAGHADVANFITAT